MFSPTIELMDYYFLKKEKSMVKGDNSLKK
jgi:hypothetical protein